MKGSDAAIGLAPHHAIASHRPVLDGLDVAAREVLGLFQCVSRDRWVNGAGGDVGCSGSERSLLRHTANYLAAADLAQAAGRPPGPVIDVGGGVGALGVWLASRLGTSLWLVDPDPGVRRAAVEAFEGVRVFPSTAEVPAGTGAVVTAMEVIEHLPPGGQVPFAADLYRLAAPGGLLALSTPDESGFAGGWSGYGPHVGVLDEHGLRRVLRTATGLEPAVWRLEGEPFRLRTIERWWHPVGNRLWRLSDQLLPRVSAWVGHQVTELKARTAGWRKPQPQVQLQGRAWAVAPEQGTGTGLLATVGIPD